MQHLIPFCSFNLTSRSGQPCTGARNEFCRSLAMGRSSWIPRLVTAGWDLAQIFWPVWKRAQLRLLRETVAWAEERSPSYRESLAGIDPASLTDLEELPASPADHARLLLPGT